MRIERVKACLNGGRRVAEHPAVPVTPAQLAAAATSATAAGAEAVHVHPRDGHGAETLAAPDIGAAVGAIRRACPDVPVGVSTGLWIAGHDPGARLDAVAGWSRLPASRRPDFASVNLSEPGFGPLALTLWSLGVAVEAGVWSTADADALAGSGLAGRCLRVLVEIIGTPRDAAPAAATAVLDRLEALDCPGPRLLHGEDEATWPLVALAGQLGLATRIGLEDTTTDPDGAPVAGNAELVRLALATWTAQRPSPGGNEEASRPGR
ncbi:3-keto-5-aminohexanoate cleavage protein [Longispora sp. NPDC051575]|uniref:3-keto-5-aminohexanoate cleavage protein n=1 Tax=Longispora sp. NPDC051575 TaxID=3154943 RepID=UPI00343CE83D